MARAEHALESCRVREHETIAELYRFKAQHSAIKLNNKEVDVGHVRAAMNRHDLCHSYLSPFSKKPRIPGSDGVLVVEYTISINLTFKFVGTIVESVAGRILAVKLD